MFFVIAGSEPCHKANPLEVPALRNSAATFEQIARDAQFSPRSRLIGAQPRIDRWRDLAHDRGPKSKGIRT
jgi:hypothetical protein